MLQHQLMTPILQLNTINDKPTMKSVHTLDTMVCVNRAGVLADHSHAAASSLEEAVVMLV